MEIRTIITCLLLTVPLHNSEDETLENTNYCTPYCATPCHQQPKKPMEIRNIITCLLYTTTLHYSENETLAETRYCTFCCATNAINNLKELWKYEQ